ncbi:DinB family protein [Crateriforma conspicua]|uniref:DinB family protein n=1 Tax=Crateriforma conspicua TaxID=2527996 RepID=A0A5C6FHD6_9PLAN|nr:DinB family protein [Crateriforma conspicua]TWU61665.1 DinB family protein [Crateriforma conspicua]
MTTIDLIRRLHQHRTWTNQQLLASVGQVAEVRLHTSLSIGQGSIWKTLVHLMAAEYVWLEALQGNEDPVMPGDVRGRLPGNQQGDGAIENLAELRRRWNDLDRRWTDYLAGLTGDDLQRPVIKVSTSSGNGTRHACPRADVLMHVCTHAQYTSAQLVNMLRQLGVDTLPDVMLITLARQENDCQVQSTEPAFGGTAMPPVAVAGSVAG